MSTEQAGGTKVRNVCPALAPWHWHGHPSSASDTVVRGAIQQGRPGRGHARQALGPGRLGGAGLVARASDRRSLLRAGTDDSVHGSLVQRSHNASADTRFYEHKQILSENTFEDWTHKSLR